MSTIILGAGVIGCTLAYYLAKAGQDVIVIERQADVALETSFANAGQISYAYASPWAAPGVPIKAIQWLLQKHAPLSFKLDGSLFQLKWIMQFLMNCRKTAYSINKERMLRLAEYSSACLAALRQEQNYPMHQYDGAHLGTLQIFRTQQQLQAVADKDLPILTQYNIAHRMLNRDQVYEIEPALSHMQNNIVGGLHLPNDETGDCHMFTKYIAEQAKACGARFMFNTCVDDLLLKYAPMQQAYGVKYTTQTINNNDNSNMKSSEKLKGSLEADHIVVALGSYSRNLLKDLVNIPVYPIKGYSITADIHDEAMAPRSTILDETYKIALTRLNKRIRVGGMANITGFNLHMDYKKIHTLNFVLQNLFPHAYNESKHAWTGLRPATPDGTPIIGATQIKGLWLSTGHGTLGWTMACGSGKLLSDLILEKIPDIKYDDLNALRYF
jgi:D-amino-acid dehydrogenase